MQYLIGGKIHLMQRINVKFKLNFLRRITSARPLSTVFERLTVRTSALFFSLLITSDKGGGKCVWSRLSVCVSVC